MILVQIMNCQELLEILLVESQEEEEEEIPQMQVEYMLSAFEDKIIKKVDELGNNESDGTSYKGKKVHNNNPFGGTGHSGRWFYWSGAYRRVPEDWVFSPTR